MTANESEEWVDKLVVDMEETLEDKGVALANAAFQFDELDCKKMGLSLDQLNSAMRKATSLGLIKMFTWGKEEKCKLTEDGRARARSCMLRKNEGETGHSIVINGNNANVQVGNNNVQNVSNAFNYLLEQIDKSSATAQEKNNAKSLMKKFIEHPLVNTILGTAGGALTSLL
jgi:hypothetical protein